MNNQYNNQRNWQNRFYNSQYPVRPKTPVEIETENLNKISRSSGKTLILINIISVVFAMILMLIVGIYALIKKNLSMDQSFSMSILVGGVVLISGISISSGILWYYRGKKNWFKQLTSPEDSNVKSALTFKGILSMSAFMLGLSVIASQLANLFIFLFDKINVDLTTTNTSTQIFSYGFGAQIIYIIFAVIVAPLIEEILFRGILLKPLKRYGDGFAIVVSSILFSLTHGNLIQIPSTFLVGLLFGYITVKTNSITPAILLHFINNLYAMLTFYALTFIENANLSPLQYRVAIGVYGAVTIITVLYAIIKIIRRKKWLKLDNQEEIHKIYQPVNKWKTYFLAPQTLIYIIYTLFIMFVNIGMMILMSGMN